MDMVYETQKDPVNGESHTALSLVQLPGGKGANTALSMYRASHPRPPSKVREPTSLPSTKRKSRSKQSDIRVFMNAAVGDDDNGKTLRQNLQSNGVDTKGVVTIEGEATGACTVMVDIRTKASRMIAYDGPRLKYKPRDPSRIDSLTGGTGEKPDLLIVGLEVPREVIEPLLLTAAKADVDTILNPSPVTYIETETYAHVTHLILNEVETADLSGCSIEDLKSVEVQKSSAEKFIRKGVKNVVLTLGENGAYYATHNGESGYVIAEKGINVKDTTGAGYVRFCFSLQRALRLQILHHLAAC